MDWRRVRWERIVLGLLLGLGILFGVQSLQRLWRVEKPLRTELLNIKGIEDVSWQEKEGGIAINLKLKDVTNLQETMEDVLKLVEDRLKKPVVNVKLEDKPNKKLMDAFYEQHFFIAEAIIRGNFGEMKSRVDQLVREAGVEEEKIYIGDKYLFVQMKDGKNYLYRLIERHNDGVKAGGGDNQA